MPLDSAVLGRRVFEATRFLGVVWLPRGAGGELALAAAIPARYARAPFEFWAESGRARLVERWRRYRLLAGFPLWHCAALGRGEISEMLFARGRKSVNLVNSEVGYVTIRVTKLRRRLRPTGNGMSQSSKKPSFGQDLVEAMKLVLTHQGGEIELEQVLPKPRAPKAAHKPRTRRAK